MDADCPLRPGLIFLEGARGHPVPLLPSGGCYPACCAPGCPGAAVGTGLRSSPQFTNVQLVLVPSFLPDTEEELEPESEGKQKEGQTFVYCVRTLPHWGLWGHPPSLKNSPTPLRPLAFNMFLMA